jgi:hypothetical protein
MGKYINQTSKGAIQASAGAKARAILEDGAIFIPQPKEFVPNLVCIVDNGFFGAAAYCYSEEEFKVFNDPSDHRPKKWFIWDKVEKFAM